MPQGRVTRIDLTKDTGYVQPDGWTTELAFKRWALAPEAGGKWPVVDSYVQFLQRPNPAGGTFVSDLRQLTPPRPANASRTVPVPDSPLAGVKRMELGELLSLKQVDDRQRAAQDAGKRMERLPSTTRPVIQHRPVDTEWSID